MSWLEALSTGVEALVLAVVIYAFIRFLQETRGSAVLKGFVLFVMLLGVTFFVLARWLQLAHLRWIADRSITMFVIALVVIFQPELRQALVKLGESRLIRRFGPPGTTRTVADEVAQAVERLARRGLGAIILIERQVGIAGFTEGGIQLDAIVTAPLLVSIFFKDTPLHDGAVIIRGNRIVAAGCLLPLTENPNLSKTLGTRHRAAIGATEENDAIAVVVSEENQRISIASRGKLEGNVTPERVAEVLRTSEEEEAEKKPSAEGAE